MISTTIDSSKKFEQPIFTFPVDYSYNVVLGCPRSGTTFLIDCLKAMSNSECISGHLLPIVIPHLVNQNLSPEIYQALATGFEFTIKDFLESTSKARLPAIQKWLNKYMSLSELIQALKQNRKIERVIYKEPFLSFAPEFTYHALPNCRIVHIYRDGRDAADSLMRKYKVLTDEKLMYLGTAEMPLGRKYDRYYIPWWVAEGKEQEFLSHTPYVRSVWMWKEITRRCHDFFSRPDVVTSNRVLLVKYEDLVRDPIFYGTLVVEHFQGMMNHRLERKFRGARTSSIGVHQKRNQREINIATDIAREELKQYGYL